jgi:uncharacterized membrane protein
MTEPSLRERSFAVRANVGMLRLSRRWLRVALIVIGTYVSLPFVAPTLMHLGLTGPGRVLYTLYSPFCHQFAFRSFFLFGEQPFYPRALAGTNVKPFEAYTPTLPEFAGVPDPNVFTPQLQFAARDFVGNEQMGYKTTLCERDVSIYLAMFTGGLIYSIPAVRRRLRPVPLWLYVILGLAPIAIDGFSQLLGYPPFSLWPPRETTPYFRVMTGALFGLMNAWLAFPYLELSMRETKEELEEKLDAAGIRV